MSYIVCELLLKIFFTLNGQSVVSRQLKTSETKPLLYVTHGQRHRLLVYVTLVEFYYAPYWTRSLRVTDQ